MDDRWLFVVLFSTLFALVFGLLFATVLTLSVVPVMYKFFLL